MNEAVYVAFSRKFRTDDYISDEYDSLVGSNSFGLCFALVFFAAVDLAI